MACSRVCRPTPRSRQWNERPSCQRSTPSGSVMAQSGTPISVLIVEDDDVLRREFVGMIDAASGIQLLDAVDSLLAARAALATRGAPDVLVIDLGLPDGDGTGLIVELAVSAPEASALVITVFGDEDHVLRALEAGAKGYLLKDVTVEEFAFRARFECSQNVVLVAE